MEINKLFKNEQWQIKRYYSDRTTCRFSDADNITICLLKTALHD